MKGISDQISIKRRAEFTMTLPSSSLCLSTQMGTENVHQERHGKSDPLHHQGLRSSESCYVVVAETRFAAGRASGTGLSLDQSDGQSQEERGRA